MHVKITLTFNLYKALNQWKGFSLKFLYSMKLVWVVKGKTKQIYNHLQFSYMN